MARTTAPTPSKPGRWIISNFGPPSVLKWEEFDQLPAPAENEARVRILVGGIGAVDNIQRVGGYPDPRMSTPGFTPGYEFVGEVDAVGSEVRSVHVGDRVVSMSMFGAYATHTVVAVQDLFRIPASDDPVKIASLPLNFMTAYGMLRRSGVNLQRGSTVLIGSAAGGLGSAIAQLNTAFDMGLTLLGTCSPKNFEFVKSLGITPIDRHTTDLPGEVKKLTGGRGVDVAYDAAGSKESITQSLESTVQDTGEVRVVGAMSAIASGGTGLVDRDYNAVEFVQSGALPRTSFFMVTHSYQFANRQQFNHDFQTIAEAVRAGKLSPLVGRLFRLEQAVEANEHLANNEPFRGHMHFLVDAELAHSHGL